MAADLFEQCSAVSFETKMIVKYVLTHIFPITNDFVGGNTLDMEGKVILNHHLSC